MTDTHAAGGRPEEPGARPDAEASEAESQQRAQRRALDAMSTDDAPIKPEDDAEVLEHGTPSA
jgi:hypothetical protein